MQAIRQKILPLAGLTLLLALLLPIVLLAQEPPKKPESQQPIGSVGFTTGPATTYTSRRTAGITDPSAPVVFEDVTDKTPLAAFRHRSGEAAKDYIFDTPTGGVAI